MDMSTFIKTCLLSVMCQTRYQATNLLCFIKAVSGKGIFSVYFCIPKFIRTYQGSNFPHRVLSSNTEVTLAGQLHRAWWWLGEGLTLVAARCKRGSSGKHWYWSKWTDFWTFHGPLALQSAFQHCGATAKLKRSWKHFEAMSLTMSGKMAKFLLERVQKEIPLWPLNQTAAV